MFFYNYRLFMYDFFFNQLNQQSLSESEVKEDDNETEHASAAANLPPGPSASKKKKKKRKKKSKYTGNHISSEDNEVCSFNKLLCYLQRF